MKLSRMWFGFVLLPTVLAAKAFAAEPSYSFRLEVGGNVDVCKHMLGVFNERFRNMWEAEALGIGDDPNYSASSKYAFPRLFGVKHDIRMTFDMRFSKVPSSPEFDAIQWKEGRVIFGGPPEKAGPQSNVPRTALVARVDFDNDGQLDTVMKIGFVKGYSYIANDRTVGLFEEYLKVWRGRRIDFSNPQSLWDLWGGAPKSQWPIDTNGTYVRPFIYKGHTYSAQYDMDIGEGGIAMRTPPYLPRETMSILNFRFTGATSEFTKAPVWTMDTVCRYAMRQIKSRN